MSEAHKVKAVTVGFNHKRGHFHYHLLVAEGSSSIVMCVCVCVFMNTVGKCMQQ